jgi:hypothetical protein
MKISNQILKYSIVTSLLLTGCATHNSTNNLNSDPFIGYISSRHLNSYVPLDLHFTEKEKTITLEESISEIKEFNKNMGRVSTENTPEIEQWITEEIIEGYSASIPIDFNKYVPFELSAAELEELNRNMESIMELMPEENNQEIALIPIEIYSEPIIIDSKLIHPVEFPFTEKEKPRTFEDNIRKMEELTKQIEGLSFQNEEQNKEIERWISDEIRRKDTL